MYNSFEEFKKSTSQIHAILVNSGSKIKLSTYREEVAKSLGFSDVNSLKAKLDSTTIKSYILVSMFGGIIEEIHTFQYSEEGKSSMNNMFKEMVLNDMDIDADYLDDADEMDKEIYNNAIEESFYDSGKLCINCYVKSE
jgi:hypothetical protein